MSPKDLRVLPDLCSLGDVRDKRHVATPYGYQVKGPEGFLGGRAAWGGF